MTTDSVADLLIRLKNASMVDKDFIELPHAKALEALAKMLEKAGYLSGVKTFKVAGKGYKRLHLDLARDEDGVLKIEQVIRYSKPGLRVYANNSELSRYGRGLGKVFVSTSQGVLMLDDARKRKLGGEVLCRVY